MTANLTHNLRSDAQDNRDRIMAVAREAFATEGLDVPMRELARRAGVGPATLYRRFPTKEALVVEAFSEQMAACTAAVDDGLAHPDPWLGFCHTVEEICRLHVLDRGFAAAFTTAYPRAIDFGVVRETAFHKLTELIRRAKAAGRLRADFSVDDLVLLLMASGGVRNGTPAIARRLATLFLEGSAELH
ncbi:TetR/AcrR family transcriptional regulator [Lentzea albida]|uniref:Transcriptional regulator, TetR family n=1 Tax=Lentzea albida TaxID=65499 RepID=A0A1H9B9X1_9PSEU|nr:TetR/AcrR family transcriptional regulator [Lentzea albida]SEP85754.1 transcriptional regulator, TetR family [Lentzea albida]